MSHPKMLLLRVQMFPEPKHWDANQRLPREHWLHKPGLRWNLPGFGVHMAAACCSYGVSRCFKSQGPTHRPRNPHSFPAWKRQTSSNHGDFRVSCSHVTAGPLFPHASAVLPVKWSHTRPWKPRPTCWISYVSKCLKMSQNVSKPSNVPWIPWFSVQLSVEHGWKHALNQRWRPALSGLVCNWKKWASQMPELTSNIGEGHESKFRTIKLPTIKMWSMYVVNVC